MDRKKEPTTEEWLGDQVETYKKRYKLYAAFGDGLEQVLTQASKKLAPLAIVKTRPKSIASFAEKCLRKRAKYVDPVNQLTDLCGARVIVHTADEVAAMSEFIKRYFEIDEENSVDVSERLKPAEFGYRSVHYIVRFKRPGAAPDRDVNIKVNPVLHDDGRFPNRKAEVQVRTILEHAWADIAHDRAYKSSFKIPARYERDFAGVAALLEGADETFSRILEDLNVYASNYGAYLTPGQMRDEMALLKIVLKHDKGNTDLAGRIGKMAITLGDWPRAVEVLGKYAGSGVPAILRDLGMALCKMHKRAPESPGFKQGLRYLEAACNAPDKDADALASLAGALKGIDDSRVRELYRQAFQVDPSDPYPLENYLDLEIAAAGNTTVVPLLTPVINTAIERCQAQADVGVNLPWAFYMIGKFSLLLGDPLAALHAYAKAIQLSPAPWMIDSALGSLGRLSRVAKGLHGYEWARLLIVAGKAVAADREAQDAAEGLKQAKGDHLKAEMKKSRAEKTREAALALDPVKKLASPRCAPIDGPTVIVAGGCDPAIEKQMRGYQPLVLEAFRDYRGSVIGGGTKEGVSGLVGKLGQVYGEAIRTIGYLPENMPSNATKDPRYGEIRTTEGSGVSPLEPLQYWIDILASGQNPADVKVLGINGGAIASLEYRMALALGAAVGVIEESGRGAAKLLRDEMWEKSKRLLHLPADAATVRAFIGSGASPLPKTVRETLAKEVHEAYRVAQQDSLRSDDPSMSDWKRLPECLKESNAQQADHIFSKLRRIGCDWHKVSGRKIKLLTFTPDEVELLAEMEHGRWNAERLLDGWTRGEKKSVENKISPHLVSWAALPDDVRDYDRKAVKTIPAIMAKVGWEIRRRR